MSKSKDPYRGKRIAISVLLVLAAVIAAALGVLGYLKILFEFELWLVIACGAIAAIALIFWFWFLGASAKAAKELKKLQAE